MRPVWPVISSLVMELVGWLVDACGARQKFLGLWLGVIVPWVADRLQAYLTLCWQSAGLVFRILQSQFSGL